MQDTKKRCACIAFLMCFGLPLQELNGVYSNLDVPPSFRTRRYFSHHSVRDNSLQDYPSFAGETVGTRIDKYRPLVISLRFVRQLRNNTAQSLVLCTQGLPLGKNKRTSACISKMKAKFLSCGKRSTKNQGEQLQLVVVEAKGACVRRKLGAPRLAAVAARTPNKHIPLIRTL